MISELISKKTIDLYQSKSQDYLILIDKPQNWTSFNVVKKIKNVGNFKKVGHAGTLDPLATGLLIIGTGKKTSNTQAHQPAQQTQLLHHILLFS